MKQSAAVFQGSSGALTPTVTPCPASCSGIHLALQCICRAHVLYKHWRPWCDFPSAQPRSSFLLSLTVVTAESPLGVGVSAHVDIFHSWVLKNTKSSACTSRVSMQTAHAPFCLCLKLVMESPPKLPSSTHTYNLPNPVIVGVISVITAWKEGQQKPNRFPQ